MRASEFLGAVTLAVNGRMAEIAARADMRLSRLLREELGLTGTKVGCDAGDCGACTVLIDDEQACACLVPAGQLEGRRVTTVEGLANDPLGRALQDSFHYHGAAQCGICTPGMLMASLDLLRREEFVDAAAVETALGGVLCRCTGYLKIYEAVLDARRFLDIEETTAEDQVAETEDEDAQAAGAAAAAADDMAVVGRRLARLDGRPKLDGSESYGADLAPPEALWLRAIRSPHARARFRIGDLGAFVSNQPGIFRVLTAADVPGENGFGIFPDLKEQPVFAEGEVRYRGEAVAAVIGERAGIDAFDIGRFPISWEPLEPLIGPDAALSPNAHASHSFRPDNVLVRGRVERGDAQSVLATATHQAEGLFETGFVEHAYVEPEAGFARRVGDRIEIFASTQAPYMDRDEVARVLGIQPGDVRIIPSACGGGFGGKLDVSVQPMLAVAAWQMGVPVRCTYTRPESMAATTKRHPSVISARAACDAEGRILAYASDADFDTGAYSSWGPTVAGRVPVHGAGPYLVPNVLNRARAIYTNGPVAGAFRGFGVPQAAIAHEALYDELAEKCGLDRLEFRFLNALRAADETATGQVLEASAGLAQCLDALRPHWARLLAEAGAVNAASGAVRRGVGIACMWYGIGNTALSNPSRMRIALKRDGRLIFFNGAVDIGQGSTTVLTQIAAQALGLPVEAFTLVGGDTDKTFDAGKSSASRQTFVSGKAAENAALALRAEILRHTNAGEDARLSLEGSRLTVTASGGVTAIDLAASPAGKDGIVFEGIGDFDPPTEPLDAKGQGVPYATYGFAAQIASLDVDMALGTIRLDRFVAAHDVGRAVNPTLVEGQIHGGIAQGIGLALMEEYIPGRTENLHDYLIPTFGDVPRIDIVLVEDHEPLGPFGAKGVGEPALVPAAPAILGAIRHATGITIRQVPALPHRIRAALMAAGLAQEA
ncbi:xanthine dehydrogenase, molybdenum binding subunit apoprotein [Rhizobiales bacterium GAS191]|nr:xanthine dehydrogenase, molybdenum binding subunit apoprotein [Rhizobiales bacterium GAS191]